MKTVAFVANSHIGALLSPWEKWVSANQPSVLTEHFIHRTFGSNQLAVERPDGSRTLFSRSFRTEESQVLRLGDVAAVVVVGMGLGIDRVVRLHGSHSRNRSDLGRRAPVSNEAFDSWIDSCQTTSTAIDFARLVLPDLTVPLLFVPDPNPSELLVHDLATKFVNVDRGIYLDLDKNDQGGLVAQQFEQSLLTVEAQYGPVVRQEPDTVARGIFSATRYGRAQLIADMPNAPFESGDFIHMRPETFGDALAQNVGAALGRLGVYA